MQIVSTQLLWNLLRFFLKFWYDYKASSDYVHADSKNYNYSFYRIMPYFNF